MGIEQLVDEIEKGPVHADLMLASTTYTLLRRLELNPIVSEARRLGSTDTSALRRYHDRAAELFDSEAPDGYTHPDDLALAAYVFVLARDPLPDVQQFVNRVAREKRPEFPSATAVAEYVTSRIPSTTSGKTSEPAPEFYSLTGKTIVALTEAYSENQTAQSSGGTAMKSAKQGSTRSNSSGDRLVV